MSSFSQPEMSLSGFDLQNLHAPSQAPSIISLRIAQQHSVPATAATSMLTVCPAEDEKDYENMAGPSGEGEGRVPAEDDNANLSVDENAPQLAPQVALTFLLISGSRRTMTFDPETTVGRVKELVWNAWPSDWTDEKPAAPNFLRILYLGKILQDEDSLSSLSLPTSPSAPVSIPTSPQTLPIPSTIVHLSIRPFAPPSEDEASLKKNLRAARRALARSASSARATTTTGTSNATAGTEGDANAGGCCGCIIC